MIRDLFFSLPEIVRLTIVLLPILGLGYLWNRYSLRRKLRRIAYEAEEKRIQQLRDELEPLVEALKAESEEAIPAINAKAADPAYRNGLYAILYENDLVEQFPKAYLNQVAFAESDLSFWLAHPSEIGSPPDHIEFIKSIEKTFPDSDQPVSFYLHKFQMDPPHELAEKGWLVGITGPYLSGESDHDEDKIETPEPKSQATFSEFISLDEMSLNEHLDLILDRLFSTPDTIIVDEQAEASGH